MREMEFLPEWYPKVRKRRRMVVTQAWVTFTMVICLGVSMVLVQRNVYARQQELGSLQTDLCRSEEEVQHLDEALSLQKALSGKDEIIGKIGAPVEMSKVMTALDQLMPADMALVDLSLDTEEGTHATANTLAARAAAEQKPPETRVHFKLHGVSPTDVDLAEFLARLSGKSFFKQVDLMYSHEKVDDGHVMREFEVSFALELTLPTVASALACFINGEGQVTNALLQTQAQWCQRAQWVLGLSLAAMIAAFYTFVYRPSSQRLADLRDQIGSKQSNLSTNKARAEILPSVVSAVFSMQSELDHFDNKIPSNNDLGAFIHDITDLSDQCGLRNKWNVEPGVPRHDEHEQFAEWPISMKFEGDFLNVCQFLRRAEKMDRLTCVKGLKMHAVDSGKNGTVQAELSMNIYYLEG